MDKKIVIKWVTLCGCGALIFSVIAAFMIADKLGGRQNFVSAVDNDKNVSAVDLVTASDGDRKSVV